MPLEMSNATLQLVVNRSMHRLVGHAGCVWRSEAAVLLGRVYMHSM